MKIEDNEGDDLSRNGKRKDIKIMLYQKIR